jgi:bacteriocin-like protein
MSNKPSKRKPKAKERRRQEPDEQARKPGQSSYDTIELQELNDEELKNIEGGIGYKQFPAGR